MPVCFICKINLAIENFSAMELRHKANQRMCKSCEKNPTEKVMSTPKFNAYAQYQNSKNSQEFPTFELKTPEKLGPSDGKNLEKCK